MDTHLRSVFLFLVLVVVVPGRISPSEYTKCTAIVERSLPGLCPTWFVPNKDRRVCDCGERFDGSVKCVPSSNSSSLRIGYCMTYNETSKLTSIGPCPYNTNKQATRFNDLPEDVMQLNEQMCGPLNRTGLLCSQCPIGLGPAVFSYRRECLKCMDGPYGWILFFFMATFPQTILCVFVIIFRINAASSCLNLFVLAAQIITNILTYTSSNVNGFLEQFVATCYGFWNLDFFSYVIPSFCIKEGMSILSIIALEYTVALYPIIFTVVVYYCITLHDSGCKVLVCCWKPFHLCFARFRGTWELKGSVINAFVTFLLLSYSKLCSLSFSLLQYIKVHDICGGIYHRVYYDASIERWSEHHVPYVVLASIIIVFVCLPTLFVTFYQNKVFQKCLSFFKFKCVLIHELANICQGCFKNGTSPGTRDYRWFAGLYLLLRILFTAIVNSKIFNLLLIVVPCIVSTLVAILRPYRIDVYNKLDSILWMNFAIGSTWYMNVVAYEDLPSYAEWTGAFFCVPLVYMIGFVAWRLITFTVKKCRSQIAERRIFVNDQEENNEQGNNEAQLPDRLLHPTEYAPLLSSSKHLTLTSDKQESVKSYD